MCVRAPVSYDKHNSFSHLFISALWKKTAWNKPKKGCLSPLHNIWLDLNESISLQSPVACHFGWFQHTPDTHYQLFVGRNESFGELLLQYRLSYSPKSSFWISAEKPNNPRPGGDLYWHLGSSGEPRSPWQLPPWPQHLWSHTYCITWAEKGLQSLWVQRSFSIIMAHFSAEIACNSASEKWAARLSSLPGVCDVWVT